MKLTQSFVYLSSQNSMMNLYSDSSNNESMEQGIPQKENVKTLVWQQSGIIDDQDGEICLTELDIKVKFPRGALAARRLIMLQVDTGVLHPPLHENQFLLGPVISCKPDGLKFSKPVTISMPHSCRNLTTQWVQIWCKNEPEAPDASNWEMIYDGMQEHQTTKVHVEIEGQKIKFRVFHFTLFAIVTAPITKLTNWLFPPELILDVWAFLNPVNIAATELIQLRIYALKTNDEATKRLVQADENETMSGRCAVPTKFILLCNGKSLAIVLKHLYPPRKWIPNSSMEKSIPFGNIQLGGLGARCDFMFRLNDIHQPSRRFGGEFDLTQEGNSHTVEGINFTD